ncbi:MAG TPA: TolC family protein [Bacteroidales bacterium]|nr:TolC family protein [Bacteroidales bacterium]
MKKIMTFIALIVPAMVFAQNTLTLEECLKAAVQNHPRQADYKLMETISGNKLENYDVNWFPALNLNGQATYQSDVIQFNIDAPVPGLTFPVVPKDQYKLTLDVSQTIYDAGSTKGKKQVEEAGLKASEKQLESDIETEKELVKNLYFNILVLQENIKIVDLTVQQLDSSQTIVRSGVDNGMLLHSDLDLLKVETMNLEQNRTELENRKEATLNILAEQTGIDITAVDSLRLPGYSVPESPDIQRPELELFSYKQDVLGKSADLLGSKRLPVVFAFGQFGYGKPGLNMLNDKFDTWYLVGAGLKWNLWDWNQVKRDRENLKMQADMITHQRETFERHINEGLTQAQAEIRSHSQNIDAFGKILALRENISASYLSQLKNGTIMTNDYLKILNQEKIARIKLETEKILLQKAIADYKYTEGTLHD